MIPIVLALTLLTPVENVFVATSEIQGRTIAGTWVVTAEAVTGTLIIEKQNDTLTGRWNGPDGATWLLKGSVDLARFDFATEAREMTRTENDRRTTGRYRWTFRGENDHDTLRGTIALHRDGEDPAGAQPFTATRQR